MSFRNDPLDLTDLPRLDEAAFNPLDPAHLRASMLGHVLFGAIVAVAGGVIAVLTGSLIPVGIAGALLLIVLLSYGRMVLEVRHTGWQLREHDVSVRRGVLVRSVQTLPFVRVQHTRITRSFVQRRFGLSTLHVNSAGPDIAIDGLAATDAERLKAVIVERAGDLDDAVL
ncbi:MAG: PH domain-containing protein [Actinomycetota bacterium]